MQVAARSPPAITSKTWDHLSHSAIQLYRTCPLRFFFRYVRGLPEKTVSANMVMGGAIHAALEAHYRELLCGRDPLTLDDLLAAFWEHWESQAGIEIRFNKGEDVNEVGRVAERILRAFQGSKLARPEGTIIGIEESVRGSVVPGVPELVARIDLILETASTIRVVDFKTARSSWGCEHLEDASDQLLLYHELLKPLAAGKPMQLEFAVFTKTRVPDIALHQVQADARQIERTKRVTERVWKGIELGLFYPNPSPLNCPTCPYRSACRAWTG
jgi:putative RecB family exonuclease